MKFYRLNEIPPRSDDQVFKASPTAALIWFLAFSGFAIALLLLAIRGAKTNGLSLIPSLFIFLGAAMFGLFGWLCFGRFRATLKPTNWLLRCNSSGVIIRYRSYQNWRFPADDVQAVGFDYSELSAIRNVKERRTSPGMNGKNQTQFLTYLDFCLADAGTSALEAHLTAEQKAEPPGRSKTIVMDYPVQTMPGGIVQVRWNGLSPSSRKAIQYLSRYVKMADAESTKVDLTRQRNLTPEEARTRILKLAKSGDKIAAVELARQTYSFTLTEAVAFVDKLQSGG